MNFEGEADTEKISFEIPICQGNGRYVKRTLMFGQVRANRKNGWGRTRRPDNINDSMNRNLEELKKKVVVNRITWGTEMHWVT